MSATFVCPHCGASYPRKPVLVGRAVRCTSCKNAFRLREDGIADAIEMAAAAAPASPPAPPPPPPPPEPAAKPAKAPPRPLIPLTMPSELVAAPKPKAQPAVGSSFALDEEIEVVEVAASVAAAPAKTAAAKSASASPAPASSASAKLSPGGTRESARRPGETTLTSEQQDVRRAMAATLSTSMSAALKAETLKGEAQNAKPAATAEGRVGKIGPAVLTGEGVRTAKVQRIWSLLTVLAIALLGGCGWLVLHRSPARAALEFYSSAVEGVRNRTDRITAIQERAWLIGLPPANLGLPAMSDLGDARIASSQTIKLAAAKPLFAQLKGMVLSTRVPLWLPKAAQQELEGRIEEGMNEKQAVAALLKAGKGAIDAREWQAKLRDAGLGDAGVEALDLLMRGRVKIDPGEKDPAKRRFADLPARLLSGDLPDAIVLTPFYGRKGGMWINRGQAFSLRTVEYHGMLLAFTDPAWPQGVRLLSLSTAMLPGQ